MKISGLSPVAHGAMVATVRGAALRSRTRGGAPFALLAREAAGELVYAGSAFVTLPERAREEFRRAAWLAAPPAAQASTMRAHNAKTLRRRPPARQTLQRLF